MTNMTAGFACLTPKNVVRFKLKAPLGAIPEGKGFIFYDDQNELIRIAADTGNTKADYNPANLAPIDLPQEAVSQIQLQTDFLDNPKIVIRLRKGRRNKWFPRFQTSTLRLPIRRKDLEAAEKLISRISLDILEDSLDEMLDFIDKTLLSETTDRRKITLAKNLSDARVPFHDLAFLDPEFATNYLLEATQDDRSKTRHDRETAEIIAKDLDYLAIALELFISYIDQQPGSTLDAYHKQWRSSKRTVMNWHNDSLVESFPMAVAASWDMTKRQLSEDALNLLNLLCWLSPSTIPAAIFADTPAPVMDEVASYGLINPDGPIEGCFTVHRLIQKVLRERSEPTKRRDAIEAVMNLLDRFAPESSETIPNRPVWNRLAPHIEALIKHCDSENIVNLPCRLMSELGDFYFQQKHYEKAEFMIRRALKTKELELGTNHLDLTLYLEKLAILLEYTDRDEEAHAVIKRSLEIIETKLGFEHIDTAHHLKQLGEFLYRCGNLRDAETIMESALVIFKMHPDKSACEVDELTELIHHISQSLEQPSDTEEDQNSVPISLLQQAFRISSDKGTRVFVGTDYHWGAYNATIFAGIAKPGDTVRITVTDEAGEELGRKETEADNEGNWMSRITCPPMASQKVILEFSCKLFGIIHVAPYRKLIGTYKIEDIQSSETIDGETRITGSVILTEQL